MKKRYLFLLLTLVLCIFSLASGCDFANQDEEDPKNEPQLESLEGAPEFQNQTLVDYATKDGMTNFFKSTGYSNGAPFGCTWLDNNAVLENDAMNLKIEKLGELYFGGEFRSYDFYGYGYYSTMMKPAKVEGTASTFFVYTGPYDADAEGNENPHDEIDIEFLGKDTTKVQFNYFTNGVGGNEYMYDLGFDASLDYHEYGFYWAEDCIIWYVDKVPVYKKSTTIPSTPAHIMTNFWCGDSTAHGWMGVFDEEATDVVTSYKWISCTAPAKTIDGEPALDRPDAPTDVRNPSTAEDYVALSFVATDSKYVISDATSSKMTVSYSGIINDYVNLHAQISDDLSDKNAFVVKVTNNAVTVADLRIDVMSGSTCINTTATKDGETVTTDLEWGGSYYYAIQPTVDFYAVVFFEGDADSVRFYLDSTHYQDPTAYSGNITFENYAFVNIE